MATYDPTVSRVRVSATIGGTFTLVGFVTSFTLTEGSEGDTTVYYLGGSIIRTGNPTAEGSMDVIWDPADTNGQEMLRDAKDAGTTIALEFSPGGTTAGLPFEKWEIVVTEVTRNLTADGDSVNGTIGFRADPDTKATGTHP